MKQEIERFGFGDFNLGGILNEGMDSIRDQSRGWTVRGQSIAKSASDRPSEKMIPYESFKIWIHGSRVQSHV